MRDYRNSICGRLYKIFNLFKRDSLNVFWFSGINFGDGLNPYFISQISGMKVHLVSPDSDVKHYIVIGSTVEMANRNSIIWGAGYIAENRIFTEKPLKVCAVRGPKTRELLLEQGVDCPEVYGDPALLLPKIYFPKVKKKYKLGVIPHYIDKDKIPNNLMYNSEIKIIDIKRCNPLDLIKDIMSCEKIASSSLHGMIVSDAYAVPSIWIEFSDNVVGNGFKFHDYFLSVKREIEEPLKISDRTQIDDIFSRFQNYRIDIDLSKLIDACPFEISFDKNFLG